MSGRRKSVTFRNNPVASVHDAHAAKDYNRTKEYVAPVGPGAPNFHKYFRSPERRLEKPLNVAGQAAQWRTTYMRGGKKRKNKTRRKSI